MTSIAEKAAAAGGPEVVLSADLPQAGPAEIKSTDLVDCDEITEEGSFPTYGSFLEVETGEGIEYWECSGSLAGALVEIAEEKGIELSGSLLSIDQAAKTPAGEWRFVVHVDGEGSS